jgi:7-cyano-7-deazaguanine reductase
MANKSLNKTKIPGVSHLGSSKTHYENTYNPKLLEAFASPHPDSDQWVSLLCPEFTSLCPITGQPDFAKITINYIAGKKMVESKSLKLYLFSFRNHGDFHEKCVETICQDLVKLIRPKYLEVTGSFTPRGGISIHPFSQYSCPSKKYKELLNQRAVHFTPGKYS